MAPDYSQFNGKIPIAAKVEEHDHANGDVHLTIEVIVPQPQRFILEVIRKGFDLLMRKIAGSDPLHIETYQGEEAEANNIPLEDYYHHILTHPKDSN